MRVVGVIAWHRLRLLGLGAAVVSAVVLVVFVALVFVAGRGTANRIQPHVAPDVWIEVADPTLQALLEPGFDETVAFGSPSVEAPPQVDIHVRIPMDVLATGAWTVEGMSMEVSGLRDEVGEALLDVLVAERLGPVVPTVVAAPDPVVVDLPAVALVTATVLMALLVGLARGEGLASVDARSQLTLLALVCTRSQAVLGVVLGELTWQVLSVLPVSVLALVVAGVDERPWVVVRTVVLLLPVSVQMLAMTVGGITISEGLPRRGRWLWLPVLAGFSVLLSMHPIGPWLPFGGLVAVAIGIVLGRPVSALLGVQVAWSVVAVGWIVVLLGSEESPIERLRRLRSSRR